MTHTVSHDSRPSTPLLLALDQSAGAAGSSVAAWGLSPAAVDSGLKLESVSDGASGDLRENPSGAAIGDPLPRTLVPKKRGRPKGWRPGMSYSDFRELPVSEKQARVATHVATQATERQFRPGRPTDFGFPKKRGRPPKAPPLTPSQFFRRIKKPEFAIFACEWQMCKAELHNLDTLRRHMHIVHGSAQTSCQWSRCTEAFNTRQAWRKHVEQRHLVPLSWHVGDGACNNGDLFARAQAHGRGELPGFLFDKQGNQVTQSVRYQELEDEDTYRTNRHKLEELYVKINAGLPSESEEEEGSEADHNEA